MLKTRVVGGTTIPTRVCWESVPPGELVPLSARARPMDAPLDLCSPARASGRCVSVAKTTSCAAIISRALVFSGRPLRAVAPRACTQSDGPSRAACSTEPSKPSALTPVWPVRALQAGLATEAQLARNTPVLSRALSFSVFQLRSARSAPMAVNLWIAMTAPTAVLTALAQRAVPIVATIPSPLGASPACARPWLDLARGNLDLCLS